MNFKEIFKKIKFDKKRAVSFGWYLFIIDQLVKHNVKNPVLNEGAAFGILQGQKWLFLIVTLVVVFFIWKELKKTKEEDFLQSMSFVFIISGALSNFVDRLLLGHVIDYINFLGIPTFNIADLCINFGIILLIVNEVKQSRKNKNASNGEKPNKGKKK